MRICFLASAPSIHTKRWCDYFASAGHEVHLISFKKQEISSAKLHFIDSGNIDVRGKNWKVLLQVRKIRRLIKMINPDILHAHYATSYGITGALTGFHPFVVTCLGSDLLVSPVNSVVYRKMLRYVFRKADWVTVMADHMLLAAEKMRLGDLSEFSVVPFGIDTSVFNDSGRDVPGDKFIITSTRNFEPVYNIPHLINAVAEVYRMNKNIQLNLIGSGSLKTELEQLVEEKGLSTVTKFYGSVSQPVLAEVLRSSHLFVTVSLSDGNNISLNEAMACGVYCIASDIPANTQWITDGENGRIVRINDVTELARQILWVMENYSVVHSVAREKNKQIISERADWNKNMKRVEQKYTELCRR